MLAIFDTNKDISLAEINIKFTKCSNNTVAIVYSKQVVILFFECTIFVNALGRSHHPPVRFERFANDQYFIGCHFTSRFVASALLLS